MQFVDSLSPQQQQTDFPSGTLNRNVRDVFGHLHHWHKLLLGWHFTGMKGEQPLMPAPGFSWKQTPELNRKIQLDYSSTPLSEIRALLDKSHQQVQELIDQHSEEELFEKKRFAWAGSTSLGAYFISNTSSHYDWAYRLLRKATKHSAPSPS